MSIREVQKREYLEKKRGNQPNQSRHNTNNHQNNFSVYERALLGEFKNMPITNDIHEEDSNFIFKEFTHEEQNSSIESYDPRDDSFYKRRKN